VRSARRVLGGAGSALSIDAADERALGTLRERCYARRVTRSSAVACASRRPAARRRRLSVKQLAAVFADHGARRLRPDRVHVGAERGRQAGVGVGARAARAGAASSSIDGVTRGRDRCAQRRRCSSRIRGRRREDARGVHRRRLLSHRRSGVVRTPTSGRYALIGRLSNAKKLAQGVFVSVERIETVLAQSDAGAPALRALLTACAITSSPLSCRRTSHVTERGAARATFAGSRAARASRRSRCRAPSPLLHDDDFTVDNGCLTGTGKTARIGVHRRFGPTFDALYERTRAAEAAIEARGGARSLADILFQLGHDNGDLEIAERFSFRQLGGDSIAAVRCAKILQIDATALLSDSPLANVLALAQSQRSISKIDDVDRIVDEINVDNEKPAGSHILITGASGFLGKYLVREILMRDSHAHVMAMVRAKDDDAARARMSIVDSRLIVVAGDLSLERFGWSKELFDERRGLIRAAVHNGACVNASLGANELRSVNVGGTATVLRLIGRKPLVYVSTIGVLHPTSSGYAQTKLEAERLVHAVRSRLDGSPPIIIVRPGAIGPASDGTSNPIDFRVLVMREMMRQGASPRRIDKLQLRFVGVEYVARRCVKLLLASSATSALVPLVAPHSVPWSAVVDEIARRNASFQRGIEMQDWCKAIENVSFRELIQQGGIGVESKETTEVLADDNDIDSFDVTMISKMIDSL
jgi:thioester reductase-like protein